MPPKLRSATACDAQVVAALNNEWARCATSSDAHLLVAMSLFFADKC